MKFEEKISCL